MPAPDVRTLNDRLVAAAREVRVLDRIAWPRHTITAFLAGADHDNPALPQPEPVEPPPAETARELDDIAATASDGDSPELAFLAETARSYATGARLVAATGTRAFTELSRALYGAPDSAAPGGKVTHAQLAERVLAMTDASVLTAAEEEKLVCHTAEYVRDAMRPRIDDAFGDGALEIRIEADLGAKAAASAQRVRLRAGTCFSDADVDQLLEHEVFVHVATARNGAAQPALSALSLGAPRTTATQEGIATFAELVTGAMDVTRLRRIALRILAVQRALDGADFVEVFGFYREAGQTTEESAFSTARVFRGATPAGDGVAFTKDTVYLAGLFAVHTWFRRAIVEGRLALLPRLFAGRMTLADVLALDEAFDAGRLSPGAVLPRWVADPRRLAAYLAFSAATNPIDLDDVELARLSV